MLRTLLAFVPVAIVVTITPGPATAMVVRSAARGGRRQALPCTVGNSIGVLSWALLAAAGLARSWRHRPRAYDLVWYSALAYAVARARHAFVEGPWARRAERLTGVVLIGLGARLAFERR
jgi:threonine/homoserine/homoserine lactone efflux protein